jgi:hypothetical protein
MERNPATLGGVARYTSILPYALIEQQRSAVRGSAGVASLGNLTKESIVRLNMQEIMDKLTDSDLTSEDLIRIKDFLDDNDSEAISVEEVHTLTTDLINLRFNATVDILIKNIQHYLNRPKKTNRDTLRDLRRASSLVRFLIEQYRGIVRVEEEQQEKDNYEEE